MEKFDGVIASRNLYGPIVDEWRERLEQAPVSDDDIDLLNETLMMNAVDVADTIRASIMSGNADISTLVPQSDEYYCRLVGSLKDSLSLRDFILKNGKNHSEQLIRWDFQKGYALSLLSAPHSEMSLSIDISSQEQDDVVRFYDWLAKHGDRFSQVGGLEVGLSILVHFPAIEPFLLSIAIQIRDDDPSDAGGRLRLSASLVVLVDGELGRGGGLKSKPPFWRRLSAIAQASLIERELLQTGGAGADVSDIALRSRWHIFYEQTLVDLRQEPRWLPEFIDPTQLKFEFLGRIYAAGSKFKDYISNAEFRDVLFGGESESIRTQLVFPFPYLPGPLEGGVTSMVEMPEDFVGVLQRQIEAERVNNNETAGRRD